MEGRLNMLCVALVVLVAALLPYYSLAQQSHHVGDRLGWTVPPGGDVAYYRDWATAQYAFMVDDVLVFNFTTGIHDVSEVNRDEYNSCNPTNPISTFTEGPTEITLTTAGQHYFICNFPGHCDLGQRLAVHVLTPQETAAPPMAPVVHQVDDEWMGYLPLIISWWNTPDDSSTYNYAPSPSNSASSFSATVLPVTFLAVALAFLY